VAFLPIYRLPTRFQAEPMLICEKACQVRSLAAAVNSWAYDLMGDNHLPQATELFRLNVTLYPESSKAYDSLGEANLKSGQKQLAIDSYKKSLGKNPDNNDAREKLKDLQGNPPAAK
jgi:Tfp pilus assembly protein PilF